jgi:hypothetical protein
MTYESQSYYDLKSLKKCASGENIKIGRIPDCTYFQNIPSAKKVSTTVEVEKSQANRNCTLQKDI